MQPAGAKLIGLCVTVQMDNDAKQMYVTQEVLKGKEKRNSSMSMSVIWSHPNRACSVSDGKSECRQTHKQAALEGEGHSGITEHFKKGNTAVGDVYGFNHSLCWNCYSDQLLLSFQKSGTAYKNDCNPETVNAKFLLSTSWIKVKSLLFSHISILWFKM